MGETSIVDRVKDYIKSSEHIKARGMAELSPRAVAVIDNYNETDVYFDSLSYKIRYEKAWVDIKTNESSLFPPKLRERGLGVLSGVGRYPHVHGYSDALRFAKQQLSPIVKKLIFIMK